MPDVTVVVPTAGRVALTRACLESIQAAAASDGLSVETLIVDSSVADDRTRLKAICAELGVQLIPGPRSVSEKRNLGAEMATTERVMFMDSDCVIAAGCLDAHLKTLQDEGTHASQGTVFFRGPEQLAFRAVRCSGILNAFTPPSGKLVVTVAAGNLMVSRAPFLAVRFDPRLGPPGMGGEDVDFGLRLGANGHRIVATPAAVVEHETATWNGFVANARRFFSWGRSESHLVSRYPVVSYIDMPSPALVTVLLAAVSAVAVAWSPLSLLAFPVGFLLYAAVMAFSGAWHHPEDRAGGALGHWVFFVLDLGRVWESFRRLRPLLALRRLRFADNQISQEWPDVVPTSWALWSMVLIATVFLWWSVNGHT